MGLFEDAIKAQQPVRRKIFVSYYHKDDQKYRDALEKHFGHLFIISQFSLEISTPM